MDNVIPKEQGCSSNHGNTSDNPNPPICMDTLISLLQENNRHLDTCQKTIQSLTQTVSRLESKVSELSEDNDSLKNITALIASLKNLSVTNRKKLWLLCETNHKFKMKIVQFTKDFKQRDWNGQFYGKFPQFEKEACPLLRCLEDLCCCVL